MSLSFRLKPGRMYKWMLGFTMIAALLTLQSCSEQQKEISPVANLIPKPVLAKEDIGQFILTDKTAIQLSDTSAGLLKLGNYLATLLQKPTGFKMPVNQLSSNKEEGNILLTLSEASSALGKEGYELHVSSKEVSIKAFQPAGLFYGIQTLRQLLPNGIESGSKKNIAFSIPACQIKDKPEYGFRGSMLDVARHFISVADVKRYIDLISFYKMNILHLHLSDDQGWRIEIKSWPALTSIGATSSVNGDRPGFYTQEQYKEIVQYAQEKFITIIPEIDMPGHTNAALASYANLNCNDTATKLYEGIEVGFSSLCTKKEITYTFIDDVVRELAQITPGPWIHIGGDESHATSKEDYIPFVEKVTAIVNAHGKQVIGWDEIAISKLPPGCTAQFWDTKENAVAAVKQGAQIIMSPAKKAYLDMQYDSTSKLGLHWAAYIEVDSSYNWNPANYVPGISKENILGVEAPLWSETITSIKDIEYMCFPRVIGIAEIGWSPATKRNWEEYKIRLGNHAGRLKALDIHYYKSKLVPWQD